MKELFSDQKREEVCSGRGSFSWNGINIAVHLINENL